MKHGLNTERRILKSKPRPRRSLVARRGANGKPHQNGQGQNGRHVEHDPAKSLHRPPVYHANGIALYRGDCLDVLADLPAASVDTVITDPPYGLEFMGKDWDHGIPGEHYWREVARVAKPGAMLLCFGGTRTFHRLACAIEDAGWEIRDCLMWLYGQGFPKSLDVSKAIDKAESGKRKAESKTNGNGHPLSALRLPLWNGWGTALKPAWEPIILARKPLCGTVAQNVLAHGTGGLNIDGCRIGVAVETWPRSRRHHGGTFGQCANQEGETQQTGAMPAGRWPANLVLSHLPGCRPKAEVGKRKAESKTNGNGHPLSALRSPLLEEWECVEGCPVAALDRQSGILAGCENVKPALTSQFSDGWGFKSVVKNPNYHKNHGGGASRFFYCAKASRSERGEGNDHPTVKPLALMEWLCRLVTPPGGTILDPFLGSGTTALAAYRQGFRCIGIERDRHYLTIARRRLPPCSICVPSVASCSPP